LEPPAARTLIAAGMMSAGDMLMEARGDGRDARPRQPPFYGGGLRGVQLAAFVAAIHGRKTPIILSGAPGIGKSIFLAAALATLDDAGARVVRPGSQAGPPWSLGGLVAGILGRPIGALAQHEIARALATLTTTPTPPVPIVLAIDDAETLSQPALEFLRLVAGRASAAPQLILAGRDGFWLRAGDPPLRAALHVELEPLTPDDITGYVATRLPGTPTITRATAAATGRHTAGVPERIDRVLAAAQAILFCRDNNPLIDDAIEDALLSLEEAPPAPARSTPPPAGAIPPAREAAPTPEAAPAPEAARAPERHCEPEPEREAAPRIALALPHAAAPAAEAAAPVPFVAAPRRARRAVAAGLFAVTFSISLLVPADMRFATRLGVWLPQPAAPDPVRQAEATPAAHAAAQPVIVIADAPVPKPDPEPATAEEPARPAAAPPALDTPEAAEPPPASAPIAATQQPEPARPEPLQPEATRTETVQPETIQLDPVQPEPVQPEPVQPEPVQAEPSQAEPARPEATQAEAAGSEPSQAEATRPEATPPPAPPSAEMPAAAASAGDPAPPEEAAPTATTNGHPPPQAPEAVPPDPPPAPPPPAPAARARAPAPQLSPAVLATLLRRADALLRQGDVSSARLLYERAAASGSGPAALGAARTYDPGYLASIDAQGLRGDPRRAAEWYRKAHALGEPGAGERLKALGQ
jgi:hypothetical protein